MAKLSKLLSRNQLYSKEDQRFPCWESFWTQFVPACSLICGKCIISYCGCQKVLSFQNQCLHSYFKWCNASFPQVLSVPWFLNSMAPFLIFFDLCSLHKTKFWFHTFHMLPETKYERLSCLQLQRLATLNNVLWLTTYERINLKCKLISKIASKVKIWFIFNTFWLWV